MKQEFIHIFVCNNLITAVYKKAETYELLFSNVRLLNLNKVFGALAPFHHLPIRIILNTPNPIIKSFNTKGMNRWHQFQLTRRLAYESTADWYAIWKENHSLIFIKGNLSEGERAFIHQLNQQRYLIQSIVPALWLINNTLLKGHEIKLNGVVLIPTEDQFLQILYLDGSPTIARIINTTDTTDWIEFVRTKHHLHLEVLDATRLISLLGKSTDTFETFLLDHLPKDGCPNNVFSGIAPRNYYVCANSLKYIARTMIAISAIFVAGTLLNTMDINTHQTHIDSLLTLQNTLLEQYKMHPHHDESSKVYIQKRQIVETFNAHTFPTMYFLERISTILPHYGQVIYVRITPSISNLSPPKGDDFSVHLRLVPLKSSKNIQLLTTDLHKLFGDKLQVHIVHNPTVSNDQNDDTTQLKHTIQVNMTGKIHELQRLTP